MAVLTQLGVAMSYLESLQTGRQVESASSQQFNSESGPTIISLKEAKHFSSEHLACPVNDSNFVTPEENLF